MNKSAPTFIYLFGLFLVSLTICNCTAISNAVHGVNREIEFASISEYNEYVSNKYHIDPSSFYYLDSSSFGDFLAYVVDSKTDYYLGTYINDSMEVKNPDTLAKNKSCVGRVMSEIKNSVRIDSSTLGRNEILKNISYINLATKQPLQFTDDKRIKIILIYSYQMGTLRKKIFRQIRQQVENSPNHELAIISIDPVFGLKD